LVLRKRCVHTGGEGVGGGGGESDPGGVAPPALPSGRSNVK